MVLAYDLLVDRCTIDVIITKFFLLRVEIEESPLEALSRYGKQEEQEKAGFFGK